DHKPVEADFPPPLRLRWTGHSAQREGGQVRLPQYTIETEVLVAVRRGVAVIVAIIAFGVIVSFTGIGLVYLLVSRGPSIQDDSTLVLRAGGELQETVPADVVGQLIAREGTTVRGFVESLRLAKRDPRVTGVLLMPSSIDSPYWAKVQELRDAVLD